MSKKIKELRVKFWFYRIGALFFIGFGLLWLALWYSLNAKGDFLAALRDPIFAVMLLVPFIPAMIFSWLAERTEKKADDRMESLRRTP